MTDHPHRRADDPAEPERSRPEEEDSGKRSASEFFRKVKKPLIGLGLAGAATPMIQTGKPSAEPRPASAEEPDETASAAESSADPEEKVATRIAETRATSEKDSHIKSAVDRYGIAHELASDIYDAAVEAGIEPKLAYGLVRTESAFRHEAVSHVGARGLTQVMPRTAAWLRPGTSADDLFDRKLNLNLGFNYLNQLINKYGGDVKLALLAYNRGPGTVDRILKQGGNPDNGYARKVMRG